MTDEDEALSQFRACPDCGGKELGCDGAMPLADENGKSAVRLSFHCTKCGLVWADIFRVNRVRESDYSGDAFHTDPQKKQDNFWETVDKDLEILGNIFTENSLVGVDPLETLKDLTFALKNIRKRPNLYKQSSGITGVTKPLKCLKCGSENIWRNYLCGDDTDTLYSVVCKDCGKHWKEVYRDALVFLQED